MNDEERNIKNYIDNLPQDRKDALIKIRQTIKENLPEGFEEQMAYGMPSVVVPHSIYPEGYHCKPSQALPFISFASQKNYITFSHMGLYADSELMNWFKAEFDNYIPTKPDIGKSCIRFRKPEQIPYELIAELVSKITPQQWVELYEQSFKK